MTEKEGLLAAIRAAPDDDLPRLVYADWLDEQGEDERAALIRWQIEHRVEYTRPKAGKWWAMWPTGETRLRSAVVNRALNAFLNYPVPKPFTVRRGFIAEVTCPFAEWLRCSESVLAEAAELTVHLTTRPGLDWVCQILSLPNPWVSGTASVGRVDESLMAAWPGVTFSPTDPLSPPLHTGDLSAFADFARRVTGRS